MDGVPPFGHCSGYQTGPCNDWEGFANDDIFYLEVCEAFTRASPTHPIMHVQHVNVSCACACTCTASTCTWGWAAHCCVTAPSCALHGSQACLSSLMD
eukprot:3308235-Prymnesium_polylepis.1